MALIDAERGILECRACGAQQAAATSDALFEASDVQCPNGCTLPEAAHGGTPRSWQSVFR